MEYSLESLKEKAPFDVYTNSGFVIIEYDRYTKKIMFDKEMTIKFAQALICKARYL